MCFDANLFAALVIFTAVLSAVLGTGLAWLIVTRNHLAIDFNVKMDGAVISPTPSVDIDPAILNPRYY